jgi:hypothetical protein
MKKTTLKELKDPDAFFVKGEDLPRTVGEATPSDHTLPDFTSDIIANARPTFQEPNYRVYSKFLPSKISPRFVEQSIDQLEGWFEMNQIRSENEKFWLLKMSLEPETYQQVTGFIHNPPESGKYQALKKAIIKTHTDSETKRIKSLLNDMVLGERRPTQLLAEMSNLYRGPRDRIFAEIFVSRLPPTVRGILSGMQTNAPETSLETLAQWADAIMEQTESTKTITQINEVEKTERIERALSQLANRVDRIQSGARNESWVPLEYRQERGRPTNSTPPSTSRPTTTTTESYDP